MERIRYFLHFMLTSLGDFPMKILCGGFLDLGPPLLHPKTMVINSHNVEDYQMIYNELVDERLRFECIRSQIFSLSITYSKNYSDTCKRLFLFGLFDKTLASLFNLLRTPNQNEVFQLTLSCAVLSFQLKLCCAVTKGEEGKLQIIGSPAHTKTSRCNQNS